MKTRGKKLILRKESFGGIFADTESERLEIIRPEEYEPQKANLSQLNENGIEVKFFDATKLGYPLLTNAASSPSSLFFELTKRCNGTCTTCFVDANASKWSAEEATFQEVESIIRQFSKFGGFYVRISGGEPTLREDFFDIIDVINDEKLAMGLNTNGMFGEKTLDGILARGVRDIRISLDGPEEVNDNLRWEGNYNGATTTIGNIAEHNRKAEFPVQLTINVVLTKSNVDYIEYMIDLSQRFSAKISFGLSRLSGRAKKAELLSPNEIVRAAYRVQKMRERLGLAKGTVRINYDIFCEEMRNGKGKELDNYAPFPFNNSKCPLGSSGLTLDAYTRIVPCGYLVNAEQWVGEEIKGRDMLDVWHNSPLLNRVRKITRPGCKDCGYYITKCNGGCPAMAYFVEGNINGRDPYCVKDVIIQKAILKVQR